MKKLIIRIGIAVVVLVVLLLVVGAMFLGSIVKKGVETVGPAITKTQIKLDGASVSVLSGSGSLKGLFVGNPEGFKTPSAIKVGAVSLGVQPKSVFADKVHVTHVRVQAPEITFEGGLQGNNLNKILENVQAATGGTTTDKSKPAAKSEGASKKLQVDEFVISGGTISISPTLLGGKAMTVPLPDIQFKDLGQGPEGITAGELTEKVLGEVTRSAAKVVDQTIANLGKAAVDTATDAAKGVTDKATKSIGDLLKKK